MSALHTSPPRLNSGSDESVRLRFPITWSFLSSGGGYGPTPNASSSIEQPDKPAPVKTVDVSVMEPAREDIILRNARDARATMLRSKVDWEMVIPRRERPGAPAKTVDVEEAAKERSTTAPAFCLKQNRSAMFSGRVAAPMLFAAVGLLALSAVVIAMVAYKPATASTPGPAPAPQIVAGAQLPLGAAGWIPNIAPHSVGSRGWRRIPVLRASLPLSDFRLQMEATIHNKAFGWVFRAKDSNNFYVMKLEMLKAGPSPTVILSRFAVINGAEQPRVEIPLPMTVWLDTIYRVQLEAVGGRFVTWVQDRKVDEWSDSRLASGGLGLYFERGEHGAVKGEMKVYPLTVSTRAAN